MANRKNPSETEAAEALEAAQRELAYHLWERDGRPEGRSEYYWEKAGTELSRSRAPASAAAEAAPAKRSTRAAPAVKAKAPAKPKAAKDDAAPKAKPAKRVAKAKA